jgi:hypothetical protein
LEIGSSASKSAFLARKSYLLDADNGLHKGNHPQKMSAEAAFVACGRAIAFFSGYSGCGTTALDWRSESIQMREGELSMKKRALTIGVEAKLLDGRVTARSNAAARKSIWQDTEIANGAEFDS